MTIGIYKIINKINGHMYIGQSIDIERRFKEHQKGRDANNQIIDKAILKYGPDNFTYEIIEEFDKDTPFLDDVLNDSEEYYIAAYNTFEDRNHYNSTPGGDFCPMKIPEIVAKISGENNPNYGNPNNYHHSKETKRKIGEANSGKKHTEETKRKMRENQPDRSGKNNSMYNKKHSEETKRKISEANSGENHPNYGNPSNYHHSKETKRKISEANSGENHPRYKNYTRITKKGFNRGKQNYAIIKDRKRIKSSISKEKLKKWFKEQYPNEELVDNTIND